MKEIVCSPMYSTAKHILNKLMPENYEELDCWAASAQACAGRNDFRRGSCGRLFAHQQRSGDETRVVSEAMCPIAQGDAEVSSPDWWVAGDVWSDVFKGRDALCEVIKNLTKPKEVLERDEKEKMGEIADAGEHQLIGELFNKRNQIMLPETIMGTCVQRLLGRIGRVP